MNRELVDKLARALLYEGYILYPYRPSVKNSQRWTFGGIHPRSWSEAHDGSDAWTMQTQCLIESDAAAKITATLRFLHLIDRKSGEQNAQSWQESSEREISVGEMELAALIDHPRAITIAFSEGRAAESDVVRTWQALKGSVQISAAKLDSDLFRITVRIENQTELANADQCTRDEALMRSLISTHTILTIQGGAFVSLTDPPEKYASEAAKCRNIGSWPVLVGENGERDTILSSPIILYDYPQLAPESPGDLFDATEIDEILTLRILTLTDEEKKAAAGTDDRVRDLLSRTESLAREQLMSLHGTIRGLKPVPQEQEHEHA